MAKLDGKTALVIGANGMIAEAAATLLARDGATVVAMARRQDAVDTVKASITAAVPGARIVGHVGDTVSEEGVKAGVQAAYDVAGRLDPAGGEAHAGSPSDSSRPNIRLRFWTACEDVPL